MPEKLIYSIAQKKLIDALTYFLYGSIKNTSIRHFTSSRLLKSYPIRDVFRVFTRGGFTNSVTIKDVPHSMLPRDFAKYLAELYQIWQDQMPINVNIQEILPVGQHYGDWLHKGGEGKKYWPVHYLQERLTHVGDSFFLRATVHGSIATLDDEDGFSDIDLAFIIRKNVLLDPQQLLELRQIAMEILSVTYCFDPFMHHGPYYLTEIDLDFYPQGLFPALLFGIGVTLYASTGTLYFRPYDGTYFGERLLKDFYQNFQYWLSLDTFIQNSWDIEAVLGTVMLLPTIFLQNFTGQFRYKRDTFEPARKFFSEEEWYPVVKASELRKTLPERVKPNQKMLARACRLRWPGLLQRWALKQPSEGQRIDFIHTQLNKDYLRRSLVFLDSIEKKLNSPKELCLSEHSEGDFFNDVLFRNVTAGPHSDMPFSADVSDYEKAIDYLVEKWQKLRPRPIAIYQLGSVSTPGYSDLDFIIIWPEKKHIPYQLFRASNYPNWIQPFLVHPPYFTTLSLWKDLHVWYPVFNLRHLYGEQLEIPRIPESFQKGVALSLLTEVLYSKLPTDLFYYALELPIRVRVLVNTMHSFKYLLTLAEKVGIAVPQEISRFVTDIENFRKRWWEMDNEVRLTHLRERCTQAIFALKGFTEMYSQFCNEILFSNGIAPIDLSIDRWMYHFAKRFREHYWETGGALPADNPILTKVLGVFTDIEPKLGSVLKCGEKVALSDVNASYLEGMIEHVRVIKRYADTMIPMGIPPSKYYALGYQPDTYRSGTAIWRRILFRGQYVLKNLTQPTLYLSGIDRVLAKLAL